MKHSEPRKGSDSSSGGSVQMKPVCEMTNQQSMHALHVTKTSIHHIHNTRCTRRVGGGPGHVPGLSPERMASTCVDVNGT